MAARTGKAGRAARGSARHSGAGSGIPHVALLRGINVGGKHKLPMADLRAIFEDAGASEVRSYIQSGNIVFGATPAAAKRIVAGVIDGVEARFGFAPGIVLRTGPELAKVLRANPFLGQGADEKTLHVGFLHAKPGKRGLAKLDPERSLGDRFALVGAEIYLHLPKGTARSKLTNAYFDATLGTVSTFRNWRTVGALAEMAGAT